MNREFAEIEVLRPAATALFPERSAVSSVYVRSILLVVVVAAAPTGLRADDPRTGAAVNIMWRFDGAGRFPNIHPPTQWQRDKNILWKTPVEVGGDLHILDAKTGEVLTVTRVVEETTKTEKIETGLKIEGLAPGQYTYASPVAAEKNVFFFDDAGNTAVFEPGRKYRLVRVNKLDDGIVGTPFFVKDKIIIRGNNSVYCVGEKH